MTRAVIAGGGFAGLAGALFMGTPWAFGDVGENATRGRRTEPLQRLGSPTRGGIPGCRRHVSAHAMLGRARRVLVDEAPDVLEALLALWASTRCPSCSVPAPSRAKAYC